MATNNTTVLYTLNAVGNLQAQDAHAKSINSNMQQAEKATAGYASNLARAAAAKIGGGIFGGRSKSPESDLPEGLGRGTAAGNARGDSRDFARQAQGLGGLVHVYATFAANLFAVGAAFTALNKAMDVSRMEKAMDILSMRGGQSLKNISKDIYRISDGAVSMVDSMRFSSMATASNIASKDIAQLAKVAKGASIALGRDMGDSLDRLVRGVTKLEPELIDELGILTKAQEAYKKYATQIGISVNDLSSAQKSQAYLNAVLDEGTRKWASLSDEMGANPYQRLLSGIKDVGTQILQTVNTILGPIVDLISKSQGLIFALIAAITAKLATMAIPSLTAGRQKYLKEVTDLVTEQNSIRAAQEESINQTILRKQTELRQKMGVGIDEQNRKTLDNLKSNLSKSGLNADIGSRIQNATLLRDVGNRESTLRAINKELFSADAKMEKINAELLSGNKLEDSKLAKLRAQQAELFEQTVALRSMSESIGRSNAEYAKMNGLLEGISQKERAILITKSAQAVINEQNLIAANAKDKYLSGEGSVKDLFGGLKGSGQEILKEQGKLGGFADKINTIKAGASSIFLFVEKWGLRILSILTGPWGMLAAAVLAAWGPIQDMLGMTSAKTREVSEGQERLTEQVNKGVDAYSKMRLEFKAAGDSADAYYSAMLKFNITATTQLSESLSELQKQAILVKQLKEEAEKSPGFFGSKKREATKASENLATSGSKIITDYASGSNQDLTKTFLDSVNQQLKSNFTSAQELQAELNKVAKTDPTVLVTALKTAADNTKIFQVSIQQAQDLGSNAIKTFGADFDKYLLKKDWNHIAEPFRGLVENVDTIGSEIDKLSSKTNRNVGEENRLQALYVQRATIIKGLIDKEEFFNKLTNEQKAVMQQIANFQDRAVNSRKEEEKIAERLASIDKKRLANPVTSISDATNGSVEEFIKANDFSKFFYGANEKFVDLKAAAVDTLKTIADDKAAYKLKFNMLDALDSIIKRLQDLRDEAVALANIRIVGMGPEAKAALDQAIENYEKTAKNLLDKREESAKKLIAEAAKLDKDKKSGVVSDDTSAENLAKARKFLEEWENKTGKVTGILEEHLRKINAGLDQQIAKWRSIAATMEAAAEFYGKKGVDSSNVAQGQWGADKFAKNYLLYSEKANTAEYNKKLNEIPSLKLNKDETELYKRGLQEQLNVANNLAKEKAIELELKPMLVRTEFANSMKTMELEYIDWVNTLQKVEIQPSIKLDLDAQRNEQAIQKTRADLEVSQRKDKPGAKPSLETERLLEQLSILENKAVDISNQITFERSIESSQAVIDNFEELATYARMVADSVSSDSVVGLDATAIASEKTAAALEKEYHMQMKIARVKHKSDPGKIAKLEAQGIQKVVKAYGESAVAAQRAARANNQLYGDRALKNMERYSKMWSTFGNSAKKAFGGISDELDRFADGLSAISDAMSSSISANKELNQRENEINDTRKSGLSQAEKSYEIQMQNASKLATEAERNAAAETAFNEYKLQTGQIEADAKENQAKLDQDRAQQALSDIGALAGASAKFFGEKSGATKALMALERTAHALKMAQMIAQLPMTLAITIANIQAGVASLFAQGGWAGFAGAAAFLAIMAGLGAKGGGSVAEPDPDAAAQERIGTGTVFGDPTAKSKSLENSLEIWSDDIVKQTEQGNRMVQLLSSIDNGINGAYNVAVRVRQGDGSLPFNSENLANTKQVVRNPLSDIGNFFEKNKKALGVLGFVSPIFGKALGALGGGIFGKKSVTQTIVGEGLRLGGTIGSVDADSYQRVRTDTKKKSWFGSSSSTSYQNYYAENKQATDAIQYIFSNITESIMLGTEMLGFGAEAASEQFLNAILNTSLGNVNVNLQGLSSSDALEKLQTAISSISDTALANALSNINSDNTIIEEKKVMEEVIDPDTGESTMVETTVLTERFTTLAEEMAELSLGGEGLYETFQRVTKESHEAKIRLNALGIQLDPKEWLDLDPSDAKAVGAALVKDALVIRMERYGRGLQSMMSTFTGTMQELTEFYSQLLDISQQMKSIGLSGDMTFNTVTGAGGLEAVAQGAEVLRESGGAAAEVAYLTQKFDEFGTRLDFITTSGISGPATVGGTVEEIKDRIALLETERELLDLSTDAGRARAADIDYEIGVNLAAAKTVDDLNKATEELTDRLSSLRDAMRAMNEAVVSAYNDYFDALGFSSELTGLAKGFDDTMMSLSDTYNTLLEEINATLTGPDKDAALAGAREKYNEASQLIANTLLERVANAVQENANRFSDYTTGIAKITSGVAAGDDSVSVAGDFLNAFMGTTFDLAKVPMQDFLTWSEEASNNVAAQLASGLIDPADAEKALSLIGAAAEAKFQLLDALKEAFDYHLQLVGDLKSKLDSVREITKSNRSKVAELKDKQAGEGVITNRLAIIDESIAEAATKYAQAFSSGDIDEAIEMAQEYNSLVNDRFDLEMESLDAVIAKQEEYYDNTKSFLEDVNDYVKSLSLSENSTLSIKDKLDTALSQYQSTLAVATDTTGTYSNEDIFKARGELTSQADQLLGFAREYGASGAQYQQIYDMVVSSLTGLEGSLATEGAVDPEAQRQALMESQVVALESVNLNLGALETTINDKLSVAITDLTAVMQQLSINGFPMDGVTSSINESLDAGLASSILSTQLQTTAGDPFASTAGQSTGMDAGAQLAETLLTYFQKNIAGVQIGSEEWNRVMGQYDVEAARAFDADYSGTLQQSEFANFYENYVKPTGVASSMSPSAATGSLSPTEAQAQQFSQYAAQYTSTSPTVGFSPTGSVAGETTVLPGTAAYDMTSVVTELMAIRGELRRLQEINVNGFDRVADSTEQENIVSSSNTALLVSLKASAEEISTKL